MTKIRRGFVSWPIEKTHEWVCLEEPKGTAIPRGYFRRLDDSKPSPNDAKNHFVGN